MKNISLDIIRSTEAAAISASQLVGSGDKLQIDKVSVEALHKRLHSIQMAARVITSEGEKDESYFIPENTCVGALCDGNNKSKPVAWYDIAIDSIDGTTQASIGGPEAMSVLAFANANCMYRPRTFYMCKLAYGAKINSKVKLNINDPIEKIVELSAFAVNKKMSNMVVCLLDRPRHKNVIDRLRAMNVKLKLIKDCDVSAAVTACLPDNIIDLYYGIGGSPECILAASAVKSLRGGFQAYEVNDKFECSGNTLSEEELIKGECVFVATGVTTGSMLDGVKFTENGCTTNSVFMRSASGTVRWLKTYHNHEI